MRLRGATHRGVTPKSLIERQVPGADSLQIPAAVIAGSLVVNILGLALPLAVQEVYDNIIPHTAKETLALLLLGFIGVIVIETVLRIGRSHVTGLGAAHFEAQTLRAAYERFANADRSAVTELSDARHVARLAAGSRLAAFFGGQVRWSLIDLPFVTIFLLVMALIGGPLVLAPVIILALFLVLSARTGARLQKAMLARDEQDAKTYDFMTECLAGITSIKGAAMEPFMTRRLERLLGGAAAINRQTLQAGSDAETLSGLLGNVTFIVLAACGGAMAVAGELSAGSVAACMLLAGRIVQPVLRAAGAWNGLQALDLASDDLAAVLGLPPVLTDPSVDPQIASRPELTLRPGSAEGRALSFGFGETIVLIGPDTEGRADILRCIAGEPRSGPGGAFLDGKPVSGLRRSGPGLIAFCPRTQDTLRGTILENLTLFGNGASIADVLWAVELVGLRSEVDRLPAGFDTRLGDGPSEHLASGLTRWIALARAVAMRPRLLVLEEPQALLDANADARLRNGLSQLRGQMTIVISTSRPSYAEISDRAFMMERGMLRPLPAKAEALGARQA